MNRIILIIMMFWVSAFVIAQKPENTLVIHQMNTNDVQIPVDDVDSVYVDNQGDKDNMNVRMTDGSLRSYAFENIDYMDFIYVDKGPQAVDLGLSSLWASYNIGATCPEEAGDFFAWGETSPKSDYSEESYLYYKNGSYQKIANNISGTEYDAATAQWGSPWRMPNRYEITELMQCEWKQDTVNGVDGYRVTGKTGNSIFLPAAGYSWFDDDEYGTTLYYRGSLGSYWSSSCNSATRAYYLRFSSSEVYPQNYYIRRLGFTVRAVQ